MRIQVPFYKNTGDGSQCMQVAMQSVLKHFLNKEFSLKELDRLTNRGPGLWTWTSQVVTVLHECGLNVRFYSKTDLKPFLQGEPFIKKHFGKDAKKILQNTDISVVIKSIHKLQKYNIFKQKKLLFSEIEQHITKGRIPLMLIDHNKIVAKKGFYQGHFVVVTGFSAESVFYHESGPKSPKANKKVPKATFIEAWNANGTDNDVVIVYGKTAHFKPYTKPFST